MITSQLKNILPSPKVLLIFAMLASSQAQGFQFDGYTKEQTELVIHVMVFITACEVGIPSFTNDNYYAYQEWKKKYEPIVEWYSNHPEYKRQVKKFREMPYSGVPDPDIVEICKNISATLRE